MRENKKFKELTGYNVKEFRKKYPKFYKTWNGMEQRINNPNDKRYYDYGGRGLTCDYNDFYIFTKEMFDSYLKHIKKYGEKNTTIERIDNNLGYIKGNIKWATWEEQYCNKRTTVSFIAISPQNEFFFSKNANTFAKEHNLDRSGISKVIHGKRKHYKNWKFKKI